MRGQADNPGFLRHEAGITPADAGTRKQTGPTTKSIKDHPRGCGDKYISARQICSIRGSPPRMRGQVVSTLTKRLSPRITPADAGTRLQGQQMTYPAGITPADAGTSASFSMDLSRSWDHPRGCGDK